MAHRSRTHRQFAASAASLAAASALGIGAAAGAVQGAETKDFFLVTTTEDGAPGSLRHALAQANATSGAATIFLERDKTYQLTCTAGGQLTSAEELIIVGNGSSIQQTCPGNRVLLHDSADELVVSDVTMFDGNSVRDRHAGNGGAIMASGTVTLVDATLTDNTASGAGGGIYAAGSITLINSHVDNNGVDGDGGSGLWMNDANGLVTMRHSSVNNNLSANGTPYAGIYAMGGVDMEYSEVNGNVAEFSVSGIFAGGDVALTSSSVNENEAGSNAGIVITNGASGLLTDSSVDGNVVFDANAGIVLDGGSDETTNALELVRSSVSDNKGQGGLGILTYDRTDVHLDESAVDNNVAVGTGGYPDDVGITVVDGDVTLINSSVSGNAADNGSSVGISVTIGNINVQASTVADNSAAGDGAGVSTAHGRVTVDDSTIADNLAENGRAGVIGTAVELTYATVAENQGTESSAIDAIDFSTVSSVIAPASLGGPLCVVARTDSGGFNFEQGSDTCGLGYGAHDVVNGDDARLGGLTDNGGPTPTMEPQRGSPLLNQIPRSATVCAGEDQRGVPRPQGGRCDVGAVERVPWRGD
ncbi:MAG: choice-of-anchor Q domain-containing protein [Actinomycetota bacterium]